MYTFIGHKGQITTLDMVNGSNYLASGSLDGHIMVWDLVKGLMLLKLDAESPINAVLFSQKLYWLVIGTENGIRVLDIPKQKFIQDITATSLKPNEVKRSQKNVGCTSLAWSKNSMTLYSGWTDNTIRTYNIEDLGKTA
jgi:guanine nucleotide-binding protein subunit beta-2-like 1 protein